jgi:hypothetical protein
MGSCEHGNELQVSIKGVKSIGKLSDYWLLKDCSMELVTAGA